MIPFSFHIRACVLVFGFILSGILVIEGGQGVLFAEENPLSPALTGMKPLAPLYSFRLPDIDGHPVDLKTFKGKVLLIVNTASMCGNTPQYAGLQEMYERYRERGFEVLAFPANDFGQQEPGMNEEIKGFCYTKYSVSFPLFSKISVTGNTQHPLYQYLTEQSPFPGQVTWNFQKYLVDRSGHVVGKYDPGMNPLSKTIIADVETALAKS